MTGKGEGGIRIIPAPDWNTLLHTQPSHHPLHHKNAASELQGEDNTPQIKLLQLICDIKIE